MSIYRHLQAAFIGGEIDTLMTARVDTDQYALGLDLCENFVPVNEGPLIKRPGFEYIRDAAPTAEWLSAFRFSITQEYVLEWSDLKLRFFTNGVRIEPVPPTPLEVTTPYPAAIARELSMQQSFDRLYIDHRNYKHAALTRTGAIAFSYAPTELINGPFLDQNVDEAVTLTVSSAALGPTTITVSAPIFEAGDIGAPFRIEAKDFSDLRAWEPGMKAVVIGDKVRSDGKAYEAETAGVTGTIQPTHSSGSEYDGQQKQDELNSKGPYGIKWKYLHDRFGIVKLTGFTSATEMTGDVVKRLPNSTTSVATHRWSFGAFSTRRGWPSLVCNWAGRQIHIKDFDLCASVAGDYLNHATVTASGQLTPDMAFRRTLATEDPPLWITGDRKLIAGTASRELGIGAINAALAVAGDNIAAEPQSFYGSEAVFPVQMGSETIFVERGGRRLRASAYEFSRDRYVAADLTAAARNITRSGIVQLAYQRLPFALLHAVRGDGQIAVHPNTRIEIKGFARTVLGGGARALSAVSVVGADGKTDDLWVLVSRTTPGGVRREIWKQARWRETGDAPAESFFVDGGVRVAAAGGQTSFTGAAHLAGQAIAVLANGAVIPGIVVANDGSFSLPAAFVPSTPYTMIAGLPYTAEAVTLRPPLNTRNGTLQGLRQRVVKAIVRLIETLGLKSGAAQPDAPLEEIIDRPGNAPMDRAIPLVTDERSVYIDGEYDREGRARFVSSDPLPAIVMATVLNLDVSETDV
jgi:hypothetical protein